MKPYFVIGISALLMISSVQAYMYGNNAWDTYYNPYNSENPYNAFHHEWEAQHQTAQEKEPQPTCEPLWKSHNGGLISVYTCRTTVSALRTAQLIDELKDICEGNKLIAICSVVNRNKVQN